MTKKSTFLRAHTEKTSIQKIQIHWNHILKPCLTLTTIVSLIFNGFSPTFKELKFKKFSLKLCINFKNPFKKTNSMQKQRQTKKQIWQKNQLFCVCTYSAYHFNGRKLCAFSHWHTHTQKWQVDFFLDCDFKKISQLNKKNRLSREIWNPHSFFPVLYIVFFENFSFRYIQLPSINAIDEN